MRKVSKLALVAIVANEIRGIIFVILIVSGYLNR
jgi:hypothetical protein